MTDKPFDARPEDPPEMHLAAELMNGFAPACNTWLTEMIALEKPSKQVLMAITIAFSTELSMVIRMVTQSQPHRRPQVAQAVATDILLRLNHLLRYEDDAPTTPEEPNESYH